jgi:ankyrin repeat protein
MPLGVVCEETYWKEQKQAKSIQFDLQSGIGVNKMHKTYNRSTYLTQAIEKKNIELVKTLLKLPTINVNKGPDGFPPLVKAIQLESEEIFSLLLAHPNIDVNKFTRYRRASEVYLGKIGYTALHLATHAGELKLIQMLLQHPNIEVDKANQDGDSSLMSAVVNCLTSNTEEEHLEYIKTENISQNSKVTTFDVTRFQRFKECIEIFLEDGRTKDIDRVYTICCDLRLAVKESLEVNPFHPICTYRFIKRREPLLEKLDEVITILEKKNPVYQTVLNGPYRLLQYSTAFAGEIAEVLKDGDDNRNFSSYWISFIFYAIKDAYNERNKDVNFAPITADQHYFSDSWVISYNLDTPLMIAIRENNREEVEKLLAHPQIDVNRKNLYTRETAISIACSHGYLPICQMLLSFPNLDVNTVDKRNRSVLELACKAHREDIVKRLLNESRLQPQLYWKSFVYCIENEKDELIHLFLEKFKETEKKRDPINHWCRKAKQKGFMAACKNGSMKYVNLLLKAGVKINKKGTLGRTPLMIAAENGRIAVANHLLTFKHIQITQKDCLGDTILERAVKGKRSELFHTLLRKCFYKFPRNYFDTLLVGIEKEMKKLFLWEKQRADNNHYSKMIEYVKQRIELHCLAEINTFGRIKKVVKLDDETTVITKKRVPELPIDCYREIAKYIVYNFHAENKIKKWQITPDDYLDLDDMKMQTVLIAGKKYYMDMDSTDVFEESKEGYLVKSDFDISRNVFMTHYRIGFDDQDDDDNDFLPIAPPRRIIRRVVPIQ